MNALTKNLGLEGGRLVVGGAVQSARRLHHLDGLRGTAAVLVVIHHSVILFDYAFYSGLPQHSRFPGDVTLSGLPFTPGAMGDLAVCVFFVLSGYVLARSYARSQLGLSALLAKRYLRLNLPIFAVVIFAAALLALGAMQNEPVSQFTRSTWLARQSLQPVSLGSVLRDGVYGALLLGHAGYDASLWTMPIEFQGSVILIFTFVACRYLFRDAMRREGWCCLILILLTIAMHGSFLFLFGIGAVVYLSDLRGRVEPLGRSLWLPGFVIVLGLVLGTVPFSAARPEAISHFVNLAPVQYSVPLRRMPPESFWHAIGAVLLLISVDANPRLRSMFSSRLFQWLGEISFPLYLVHIPLLLSVGCGSYMLMLDRQVPVLGATVLSMLLAWTVILMASVGLTWTVERVAIDASAVAGRNVQALADGCMRFLFGTDHASLDRR